ncbi:MAG: hypothetical protein K2H61_09475 [Muribaculaceae bacterium]|nr:hypothetical protein [Muribaculaceae bacterium]
MKKKRITYGVFNYVEWHARIKMGKARMKVSFTGGSISSQGVIPATHTTSNPIAQLGIEQSEEFKSGIIKKIRSVTLDEEMPVERERPKKEKPASMPTAKPTMNAEEAEPRMGFVEVVASNDVPEAEQIAEAVDAVAPNEDPIVEESETEPAPATVRVEFEVNEDAKEYLEQNYGCTKSKLRTRADIVAAGKAHGVDIVFV